MPCLVSAPSSSQRLGSRLPSAFSVKVSLNLRHSTSLFSESALKLCLSPSCLPFHHQGKMWDCKDSVFCLKSQTCHSRAFFISCVSLVVAKVGNGSYHLVHRKCIPGRCSCKLAVKVVPLISHLGQVCLIFIHSGWHLLFPGFWQFVRGAGSSPGPVGERWSGLFGKERGLPSPSCRRLVLRPGH